MAVTIRRNGTAVTLQHNLTLTRTVSRPNANLRERPTGLPEFEDRRKSAFDEWELTALVTNMADANTLRDDIIAPRLGVSPLELDFDGLYGLGTYDVFPPGAQSLRISRRTGERDILRINPLTLRTVFG